MRNVKKAFRVASLTAPLAMVTVLCAPGVQADGMDTYWKSAPTTTAWVNPYGECWQGVDGENLAPCNAFVPHTPLVMRLLFELDRYRLEEYPQPGGALQAGRPDQGVPGDPA